MVRAKRGINVLLVVAMAAVVVAASSARAQDCTAGTHKDPGLMTADVALARPVGIVATVTGFALYVVSSPFSAMGGNSREAWESLVQSPAEYTFKRPLGHFDCEPLPSSNPPK